MIFGLDANKLKGMYGSTAQQMPCLSHFICGIDSIKSVTVMKLSRVCGGGGRFSAEHLNLIGLSAFTFF